MMRTHGSGFRRAAFCAAGVLSLAGTLLPVGRSHAFDIDPAWVADWTDEQLQAQAIAYYRAADETASQDIDAHSEVGLSNQRQQLIHGLLNCGAFEAAQQQIETLDDKTQYRLVEAVLFEAPRDPHLHHRVVIDLLADTPHDLLRLERLLMFAPGMRDGTPTLGAVYALSQLEILLETIELPEDGCAPDPDRPTHVTYPGREDIYEKLVWVYLRHGQPKESAQALAQLTPGTRGWSRSLRWLTDWLARRGKIGEAVATLQGAVDAALLADEPGALASLVPMQASFGDEAGATTTLARLRAAVSEMPHEDAADTERLTHLLGAAADGYLMLGDRAAAEATFGEALSLVQRDRDATARDRAVYLLIKVCLLRGEAELAAGLLDAIEDPAHAAPPARNIVVLYLQANDAQGAQAAYDRALANCDNIEGDRRSDYRRHLTRDILPWVGRAHRGEPFVMPYNDAEVRAHLQVLVDQRRVGEIDAYLESWDRAGSGKLQALGEIARRLVQAGDTERGRALLAYMHGVVRDEDLILTRRVGSVDRDRDAGPTLRALDPLFGPGQRHGHHVVQPPNPALGGNLSGARQSALKQRMRSVIDFERGGRQRLDWLERLLSYQLQLGLIDEAVAAFEQTEDPAIACGAATLACNAMRRLDQPPAGLARLADAVAARSDALETPLRLAVLIGLQRPTPGHAEIGVQLRGRIDGLHVYSSVAGVHRLGRARQVDPFDAQYSALYEQGVLGDTDAYAAGLAELDEQAKDLADPYERAYVRCMIAGLQAAFGDASDARKSLALALSAYEAYTRQFDPPPADLERLLAPRRRALLEDLFRWSNTLGAAVQPDAAGLLLDRQLALLDDRHAWGSNELRWYATVARLAYLHGRGVTAQRAIDTATARLLTSPNHAGDFGEILAPTLIDADRSPALLWQAVVSAPEADSPARQRAFIALTPAFVLHDADAWAQAVEAVEDPAARTQLFRDGAQTLAHQWRLRR